MNDAVKEKRKKKKKKKKIIDRPKISNFPLEGNITNKKFGLNGVHAHVLNLHECFMCFVFIYFPAECLLGCVLL